MVIQEKIYILERWIQYNLQKNINIYRYVWVEINKNF